MNLTILVSGSSDFTETDYEVDLNTLELSKVFKRRRTPSFHTSDPAPSTSHADQVQPTNNEV